MFVRRASRTPTIVVGEGDAEPSVRHINNKLHAEHIKKR